MQKKSIAVLDANVVVSGIFWRSDSYRCLLALARREFMLAGASSIFGEYREVAARVKAEINSPFNPDPLLNWMKVKDNIYIGCALAANASFVVTQDKDLLILKKPFGIEMIRPREFLRKLRLQ